jgi:site-specific recombinase XerD
LSLSYQQSDIQNIPPHEQANALEAGLADSTRSAYQRDLCRFIDWGGIFPATPKIVSSYLVDHANTHKYATLVRWKISIGKSHSSQGLPDPTKTELVNAVLNGIKKKHGQTQRHIIPLTKDEIMSIVEHMGDRLKDKRDRALILIGFTAGLRRSDLVSLNTSNILEKNTGLEISLPKGNIDISCVYGPVCPVNALKGWLSASNIEDGAAFQGINRHGKCSGKALTGHVVSLIIKERVKAIGLDPSNYSSFSLRAGYIASFANTLC